MDDQDLYMGSANYMDNLQTLIAKQGITMENAYVSTPVCCPSRTETLSGRYYHNIGVPNGGCMNIDAVGTVFSNTTIYNSLYQSNRYNTAIMGKLTNNDSVYFCKNRTDPQFDPKNAGFTRIYTSCVTGNFYYGQYRDYNEQNGTDIITNYNKSSPLTYQSYLLGNASLEWIEDQIVNYPGKAFINYIGFHCPHFPYTPAPWTEPILQDGWISKLKVPRDPSYNYQTTQQQPYLDRQPKMNNYTIQWTDYAYQVRIASTLQVDIYIRDLVALLEKYDELNNTYIIYTSDHGYHLGYVQVSEFKILPCFHGFLCFFCQLTQAISSSL